MDTVNSIIRKYNSYYLRCRPVISVKYPPHLCIIRFKVFAFKIYLFSNNYLKNVIFTHILI